MTIVRTKKNLYTKTTVEWISTLMTVYSENRYGYGFCVVLNKNTVKLIKIKFYSRLSRRCEQRYTKRVVIIYFKLYGSFVVECLFFIFNQRGCPRSVDNSYFRTVGPFIIDISYNGASINVSLYWYCPAAKLSGKSPYVV